MRDEDMQYLWALVALLAVVGFCLWLSSCVDRPDMSRREAIAITNLTKELTKNEHP